MSLLGYLKDKRFFFAFYITTLIFVSLVLFLSSDTPKIINVIIYINICCFLFCCMYIFIGFYYRNRFYKELLGLVESHNAEAIHLLPIAQKHEQKLFLNYLKKILNNYNEQLQKLYDEKRDQQEFILSWIHEVKLPIAASRLLIDNSEGKEAGVIVDKFEDELDKIEHYVEQALYYSRVDSFSKDYFITEIPVNQIVKNSVKKYAKLFISKGINLKMNDEVQFVHSDSKWLGFIFDQIIVNSLKYTDEGGEVSYLFEEDEKERRVLIRDTGIGIKPEDINRVFEKGFTGSTGRSNSKSTGMGLYLANELANKLGHFITIESKVGMFTSVTVHFPKIRNYYQL